MTEAGDITTTGSLRNLTARLPTLGRKKQASNEDEAGEESGGGGASPSLSGKKWSQMLHGVDSNVTPAGRRRLARENAAAGPDAEPRSPTMDEPQSPGGLRGSLAGDSRPALFVEAMHDGGSQEQRKQHVARLQGRQQHKAASVQLPRGNFSWLPQLVDDDLANHMHTTITATEIASKYGCPEEHIISYLRREIEEAESCQSLPFTVLMIAAFTVMIIAHDPIIPINSVEDSLMHDVVENANYAFTSPWIGHKGFENVNNYADFWSFMIRGFTPLVFQQSFAYSESLDVASPDIASRLPELTPNQLGMMLNYNRILGGVRVRQERSSPFGCTTPGASFYARDCVGGFGYELFPETWVAFTTTDPRREFWLWSADSLAELVAQLEVEELEGWLDEQTRKIEVALPVFNGEFGVLTIAFVNFFWSPGGRVWKRIVPMSTYSNWWHGPHNYILDVVWASCILWLTVSEMIKINRKRTVAGWSGVWKDYVRVWTVIDWISLMIAYAVIVLFSFRLAASLDLSVGIEGLAASQDNSEFTFRVQCQNLVQKLDDEVKRVYELRLVVGIYPMMVILRLFKAFHAQAALSIVTRTLYAAGIDLIHFLLVFVSIFLSGAVGGILLFGREVDGFTTLDRSMVTLFRAMMTDFEWDDMVVIGRYEAGFFFIIFMVIMVMLMLNMLLAIVMDAYSQEKERTGNADTLVEETLQNWRRWRGHQKGLMMSLADILRYMNKDIESRSDARTFFRGGSGMLSSDGRGSAYNSDLGSMQSDYTARQAQTPPDRASVGGAFLTASQSAAGMLADFRGYRRSQSAGTQSQTSMDGVRKWFQSRGKAGQSRSRSFDSLVETEKTVVVTLDRLKAMCPKMQTEQAFSLLEDAIIGFWNENKENVDVEESLRQIRKVDRVSGLSLRKIKSTYESLFPEVVHPHHRTARQAVVFVERGPSSVGSSGSSSSSEAPDSARQGMRFGMTLETLGKRLKQLRHHAAQELKDTAHMQLNVMAVHQSQSENDSELKTLQSLEEVPEWGFVKILDHEEAVLNSCRLAGIGTEHDAERLAVLGDIARCINQDRTDNTVCCRVDDGRTIVDVWMPLGAITILAPARKIPLSMEDKIMGPKKVPDASTSKRKQELAQEVAVGKHTVTEAMKALSELQWRHVREQEDKGKIISKYKILHRKVRALNKENNKLQEEMRRLDDRLSVVSASKDEYVDLVHSMLDENQKLKEKLAGILATQMDYNYQALAVIPTKAPTKLPTRSPARGPPPPETHAPQVDMRNEGLVVHSRRQGAPGLAGRKYSEGMATESSVSADPVATVNLIADDFIRMREEVHAYASSNHYSSH